MRIIVVLLIPVIGLTSCGKGNLDIHSFWQCNQSQNLDSAAISTKLLGSWTWLKKSCEGGMKSADKNIRVTFNNDQTFVIKEKTGNLTQGTWKLIQVDSNSWGLDVSSPSEYLDGRILFCDDQVLFNNSYIDGCDNLFGKSN